jgi:hypothetical protein
MNLTKTKIMTNHTEIGQNISMTDGERETQRRIRHTWGAFWNLKFILLNK